MEIGRRNIEGGGRQSDYEHTNYRGLAGVTGDFGHAWSYDGYAQYYYVQFYNSNNRYLNFDRITNALQVRTGAGRRSGLHQRLRRAFRTTSLPTEA